VSTVHVSFLTNNNETFRLSCCNKVFTLIRVFLTLVFIHFASIVVFSLEMKRGAAISGLSSYIEYSLCELGLKEPEDIFLLDDDCLSLPVEELSGLSFHELNELESQFPFLWSYNGKDFEVEVHPLKKRVELIPLNKDARKTTELPYLVIPAFGNFNVYIKKGTQCRKIR